uniref:Probable periplasmic serine endoprotease DegP-like n=1 Tax=Glossina austeni TaxID=7395 RepID=A0A1A9VKE4_GLOAU
MFDWNAKKVVDASTTACNCNQGLADLVEELIPAVVNISSEQIIKQESNNRTKIPFMPRNNFFDDFREFFEHFDQFFMDRGPSVNREVVLLGSGFIIDKGGTIVTNYHVIKNAQDITVTMNDNTYFKAEVLGYDARTDLAVLKVHSNKDLPFVAFGNSDTARVGDTVIAIGNPFGLGGSVSTGIISARSRDISIGTMNEFIQTDAAINRGNSGGPLFDLNGKVIGINTAIYSPSESCGNVGIGFAIPSNLAMSIIDTLKSGKKIKHGWLGVQVQPITKEFAESLGLKDTKGALVASIVKDSPAEKGGIKVGDILLEFDGKKIDRMTQLPQMVSRTEPEKKVQVKLLRKGKEVNIKVVIEESANDGQGNNQEENKSTSDYITGLTVSNLPKESKESNPTKGVIVTNVDSNSNATLRGIKKGDIIIQLDGTDIENTNDFQKQVDSAVKKNVSKEGGHTHPVRVFPLNDLHVLKRLYNTSTVPNHEPYQKNMTLLIQQEGNILPYLSAAISMKEYCALLSIEEKQSLYSEVLNEVKNIPKDTREGIDQLKRLSKVAVAIEETIDSKLLEKFYDGHPLREVNIAIYAPEEAKNYLFSLSGSSELYDLKEDRGKAVYHAIKSNDRELVKHLLMILVAGDIEIEFFKELKILLSEVYEELNEQLSQDMKNYLEKNISLKRFVCSNVNILVAEPVDVRAMINLFIAQSGVNYKIDELLLIKIAEGLEEGLEEGLQINQMIELLMRQERFMELEYKINDQELRKVFYLLAKFARVGEESSKKTERIKIAKGLVKAGISVDVVSKTIGLFANECTNGSIHYKVGKKIKEWRLVREYTQKDLAKKIGITRHKMSKYEQGETAVPLEKLYEIAEALLISITDLLPESTENEVENELPGLIEEYKKIENQELRHALIKSLFEGIRICEEKVRKAERIKVAKDLVKEGISIDIILQTLEALLVNVIDLLPEPVVVRKDSYCEDEDEEILYLTGIYGRIQDHQELRKVIRPLIRSVYLSEKINQEGARIEIAKNLLKEGVSVEIIFQTTGLSIYEYDNAEEEICTNSIYYKIGQRIKEWRLIRRNTQKDLADKVGLTPKEIHEYERGYTAVSFDKLYEIAEVLSVNIKVLLPKTRKNEDGKEENRLLGFLSKYRKTEDQKSVAILDGLVKSLSESMEIDKEKVKKAEKIKVAKDLVKAGIDIILRTSGLSPEEIVTLEHLIAASSGTLYTELPHSGQILGNLNLGRELLSTSTIFGMTSPARSTTTMSPLLTTTPPMFIGTNSAIGVSTPVLPTCTDIFFILVFPRAAGNLCAIAPRGALLVFPNLSYYAIDIIA